MYSKVEFWGGGIFMLVANNAKPLCGGLAHRGSEPFVMAGEKD